MGVVDAAPGCGERKEGTGAVDTIRQKGRSNTGGSKNYLRDGGGRRSRGSKGAQREEAMGLKDQKCIGDGTHSH